MDDPVESFEHVGTHVANVRTECREFERGVEEVAPLVEERVQAGHLVTGLLSMGATTEPM